MDSVNGAFTAFNNDTSNDDFNSFFNDITSHAFANGDTPFDPALLEQNGLASYAQQEQPSHSNDTNMSHDQRQSQSQSPALSQYGHSHSAYPTAQYSQSPFNPHSLGHTFEPPFAPRSTASPGSFDQYGYPSQPNYQPRPQQHMNVGQPQFNYFNNTFGSASRPNSTPSTALQPQNTNQAQQYMNAFRPSSQQQHQPSQPHISQVQNIGGVPYTYPQGHQLQRPYLTPSMLGTEGRLPQHSSQTSQTNQNAHPPYFPQTGGGAGATLDPRSLSMPYAHLNQMPGGPSTHQQQQMYPSALEVRQNIQATMPLHPGNAATMQAAGMPQKAKTEGKTSANLSDSDDDLEIEDNEPPEPRPASITIAKPSDERGKLLWEIVDAVWFPRNKSAPSDKIRSAVKFVGDAMRGLRDTWKDSNDQLKKAENSKQQTEGLRSTVSNYREIMETAVTRITRFGHPSILKRLGENLILLSALYSFLLDRVNVDDYESSLVVNILKLGVLLETVDEEQLEKVKWTKILGRFAKKCSNESKSLAQQILANSKKAVAHKKLEAAIQAPASPSGSATGQIAGVKRQREGSDGSQPTKKIPVKQASKPLSLQLLEQRKLREKEKAQAASTAKVEKSGTNGATAPKAKVATLPPKASPFANLLSASKKPGTSNAERAAKDKVDPTKTVPVVVPSPNAEPSIKKDVPATKSAASTTSASSFLGLMADMRKPKEDLKQKVEETPNETPEVRAKRLRKEARKRLRVSWKPESELVETRIFEHDPDEDTGHEDSQTRDANDTGREGEMLKKGIMVGDLEDDDSDPDEPVMEYSTPSEVDFSTMKHNSEDDPVNLNFYKTGGNKQAESVASKAQDEMEYGKEMVIYRPGEQPSTPKEPPEIEDDDFDPIVDFGEPAEPRVRQREQQVLSRRAGYQQSAQSQVAFDLASALSSMQPPQQLQAQQGDWLQALGLSSQAQPQAQPQVDLQKLIAMMSQNNSYQTVATQQPASAAVAPNIAALLAGLQQPTHQSSYSAPLPVGSSANPNPFPGATDQNSKKKDKKRNKAGVPLDENGLPKNYKTKTCSFWLENSCTKGSNCSYRHDMEGLETS